MLVDLSYKDFIGKVYQDKNYFISIQFSQQAVNSCNHQLLAMYNKSSLVDLHRN